jgi:hypothetical protein
MRRETGHGLSEGKRRADRDCSQSAKISIRAAGASAAEVAKGIAKEIAKAGLGARLEYTA